MDATVEEGWRGERRGRILDAASRVFARRTYHAASMDEIATEAGFGKPTLYRYFPGKDALFTAVFQDTLDDVERRLAAALDPSAGVEEQLAALAAELVPLFREHFVSVGLVDEGAEVHWSKRRIFRERRGAIAAHLARAIDAGVARGELRPVRADRIARLLIGMIWSATAAGGDDRAIAEEVADFAINGLGPDRRADGSGWTSRARPAGSERAVAEPFSPGVAA